MELTIFGTGYVGLVTGTCFAEAGNHVVGVDINANRVNHLNAGEPTIFEPGLQEMLERNLRAGRLAFSTDARTGVEHGDVQFICVGTPPNPDGSSNLSAVLDVAHSIGKYMDGPTVIVDKSTVPVGTGDEVHSIIASELLKRGHDSTFAVVSNPEFLKEGAAIDDFMRPDRIIIGSNSQWATDMLRELYTPFNRNHNRLLVMDVRSAEFTKFAANAMLASRISFMNEMANIAERIGVNIENVRIGIGSIPESATPSFIRALVTAVRVFPKTLRRFNKRRSSAGYDAQLLRAVNDVNDRQKQLLFEKIRQHFGGALGGRAIAIWVSPSNRTPTTCGRLPVEHSWNRYGRRAPRCERTIL